jgi:hypothetical protein
MHFSAVAKRLNTKDTKDTKGAKSGDTRRNREDAEAFVSFVSFVPWWSKGYFRRCAATALGTSGVITQTNHAESYGFFGVK